MSDTVDAGRAGSVIPARPPIAYGADTVELLADIAASLRLVLDHLDHARDASQGAVELLGTLGRSKRFRTLIGANGN